MALESFFNSIFKFDWGKLFSITRSQEQILGPDLVLHQAQQNWLRYLQVILENYTCKYLRPDFLFLGPRARRQGKLPPKKLKSLASAGFLPEKYLITE
jgi:hypothetical protein